MDEVANYKLPARPPRRWSRTTTPAIRRSYTRTASIPLVPCNTEGDPLVEDPPFEYIELRMPDGKNYLAVLTPYEVKLGPGPQFHCVKVG